MKLKTFLLLILTSIIIITTPVSGEYIFGTEQTVDLTIHMVIHNFVTSPEDAMWIVRPVYLGYLPSMPEVIEDTIRYTLYPYALILLTIISVSGFILFSRRKNPEEKSDSAPAKILSYLNHYPPASLSKLIRELDISRGSVRYQIHRLSREGKIFSKEIGGRTFYSASPVTKDEKVQSFIQVFDDEIDWKICGVLFEVGEQSRQDIAEKTKLSPDTVYYHLSHMGVEVVRKRVDNGTAFYQLSDEMREWSEKYHLLHLINSVNSSLIQNLS